MTKFAKLSLVAALAITAANAQDLEQAIKGVDVSGSLGAQYNNTATTSANPDSSADETIYKATIALKTKASDDLTVAATASARAKTTIADGAASVGIVHANFTYTGVQGLTVIAGKQALNTPWTQGSHAVDATQTGTGALAMYNAGFATFAAAHIINNNINSDSDAKVKVTDNDLNVAAIIAPIADIATVQAWFVDVGAAPTTITTGTTEAASSVTKGASAMSINVAGKVAGVSYDVTHSTLEIDGTAGTNELSKVTLKGSVAGVSLTGAYAQTGDEGGLVAFDSDGSAGFKGFQVDLNGLTDAEAMLVSASMPVFANTTAALTYIDGDYYSKDGVKTDAKEWYAQATYAFSKNMSAYVRYGSVEDGTTEKDKARIEAVYKF